MIVAVSGKGGTGKTVIAALLVRCFTGMGREVLAIDADPDSNLAEALGVEVERTLGEIREEMLAKMESLPPGVSWRTTLEYETHRAIVEAEDFDLLSMGRPEGQGCYCAVNHVLRQIIDTLAENYEVVVIDTEAGLEHLSRRTTQSVDVMLVVTDTSKRGITTALRIKELAEELSIGFRKLAVVINRATPETEGRLQEYAEELGLEVAGVVPEDAQVRELDLRGEPLLKLSEDSPAARAVCGIARKVMELGA